MTPVPARALGILRQPLDADPPADFLQEQHADE